MQIISCPSDMYDSFYLLIVYSFKFIYKQLSSFSFKDQHYVLFNRGKVHYQNFITGLYFWLRTSLMTFCYNDERFIDYKLYDHFFYDINQTLCFVIITSFLHRFFSFHIDIIFHYHFGNTVLANVSFYFEDCFLLKIQFD